MVASAVGTRFCGAARLGSRRFIWENATVEQEADGLRGRPHRVVLAANGGGNGAYMPQVRTTATPEDVEPRHRLLQIAIVRR